MLQACFLGNASRMGRVLCFQGWPKLLWFVTESKHLSKPPRDWFPHIKDANNDTAYIEVGRMRASGRRADSGLAGTAVGCGCADPRNPHLHDILSFQYKTCKDGSVLGVTVTRIALLTHCQALTQACGYTEGMAPMGERVPGRREWASRGTASVPTPAVEGVSCWCAAPQTVPSRCPHRASSCAGGQH